jgi:hypothetical protein
MLRRAAPIFILCVLSPVTAAAQRFPITTGEFRTANTFYENFFQVATDGSRRSIWASRMELRLEETLVDEDRLRTYLHIEFLQFQEIGSSPGAVFGIKRRGRSHSFDVSAGMQWNRPRSDVGDELERAEILGAVATYAYRIVGGLHLTSQAEYREEYLKPERITASRFHEVGGGIRYRAFGGRLTPDVGFLRGVRDTGNAQNQYVQKTLYAELRTSALPRTSVAGRYRHRARDYTVPEVRAKNFGREDQRHQTSATLDVALWGNLIWNCSAAFEEGRSTRPGRSFSARTFSTGFTLAY